VLNENVDENPKLKEFLAVMQPQPKTRDLHDQLISKESLAAVEDNALAPSHADNLEIQQVGASDKNPMRSSARTQPPVAEDSNTKEWNEGLQSHVEKAQTARDADAVTSGTDADWMRNRTSRLLGLLDDDEENDPIQNTQSLPHDDLSKTESQGREFREINTTLAGQKPDVSNESDETNAIEDESSDRQAIDKSGRLFLRNLAYTIAEDDLRELFQSSETVSEVSIVSHYAIKLGKI